MESGGKVPRYRLECRYSSRAAYEMIISLSEEQKSLVKEAGFGSVLQFPHYTRIKRQLYAWLLASLDADNMILRVDSGLQIPLTAESVKRMLGLPLGNLPVSGFGKMDSIKAQKRVSSKLSMPDSTNFFWDMCNIEIISRTREFVDELGKNRFLCCFIGNIVNYIIAPKHRNDRIGSPIFLALVDPMNAKNFNWCQYLLDDLRDSAIKVQRSLMSRPEVVNLFGCCLYLQAMYLEAITCGALTPEGQSIPSIRCYSQKVVADVMAQAEDHPSMQHYKEFSFLLLSTSDKCERPRVHRKHTAKRMKSKDGGDMSLQLAAIFEKQGIPNTHTVQDDQRLLPINLPSISTPSCSTGASLPDQGVQNENVEDGEGDNIVSVNVGYSPQPLEHIPNANKAVVADKRLMPTIEENMEISTNLALAGVGLQSINDNSVSESHSLYHNSTIPDARRRKTGVNNSGGSIIESVASAGLSLTNKDSEYLLLVRKSSVPRQNEKINSVPTSLFFYDNQMASRQISEFVTWMESNADHPDYQSEWVCSKEERTVAMLGSDIKGQLIDKIKVDKHLIELALRWMRSMNAVAPQTNSSLFTTRHFIAPGFAILALSGQHPEQYSGYKGFFVSDHIQYDVGKCRLVTAIVKTEHSWSCYAWDMGSKRLTIYDPAIFNGNLKELRDMHLNYVYHVHPTFVRCMELYCRAEHDETLQWEVVLLMQPPPNLKRVGTGFLSLLFACDFNCDRMSSQLTEETITRFRNVLLHGILSMKSNTGILPRMLPSSALI